VQYASEPLGQLDLLSLECAEGEWMSGAVMNLVPLDQDINCSPIMDVRGGVEEMFGE